MADALNSIDNEHLDVFKEIGNIGAGNAVTALANILGKDIDMKIPEASVVPFNTITNILAGPESIVVGVLVDMSGDINGYILLILELHNAREMAAIAIGESVDPLKYGDLEFSELETSAILEISNILVGSFLSAIGSFTNLRITPSVPQMAVDMLGAIISIAAVEYGKIGDSVLFLKTQFADKDSEMNGHFFLIPDYKSYNTLMDSLGLSI